MSLYQTWWSYDSHVSSGHSQIHGRLWFQVKCLNINIMNRQKSCSATKMKLITLNVLYFFHNPIDKLIFLHYMTPDMRGLSCSKDAPFSWCLVLQRELRNQPVRVSPRQEEATEVTEIPPAIITFPRFPLTSLFFHSQLIVYRQDKQTHTHFLFL